MAVFDYLFYKPSLPDLIGQSLLDEITRINRVMTKLEN